MSDTFKSITEEMERQDKKWGAQRDHDDMTWLTILTEEVGESAEAVLDHVFGQPPLLNEWTIRKEVIHIAAVACQWLNSLEERLNV